MAVWATSHMTVLNVEVEAADQKQNMVASCCCFPSKTAHMLLCYFEMRSKLLSGNIARHLMGEKLKGKLAHWVEQHTITTKCATKYSCGNTSYCLFLQDVTVSGAKYWCFNKNKPAHWTDSPAWIPTPDNSCRCFAHRLTHCFPSTCDLYISLSLHTSCIVLLNLDTGKYTLWL